MYAWCVLCVLCVALREYQTLLQGDSLISRAATQHFRFVRHSVAALRAAAMALPEASAPGAPLVRARALVEHIGPQGQPDLFAGEALLVPAKVRPQEVSVRVVRVETGRAVVLPTASRLYAIEGSRAIVRASFEAGSEGELSAAAGQLATILHGSVDDGWLLAAIVDTSDILHAEDTRARIGFLPASYVEIDAPSGMSASAASAKLAPVPPQDLRRAAARAFGEDSGLKARSCARWLIDPRNNPRVAYWDATTASALIFTALITPFEVGFLDPPRSFFEPLFLINLMITLIFAVDCALQFVLLVEVQTPMGYIWVSDMRVIARTYLRSWFTIDVLSIGVSAIDFISLADSDSITTESMSAGLSDLRALRILRALRLIRLMKLLTSARVIKRWEVKVAINYPALSLAKALLGMLLMSHWFACIWGARTRAQDVQPPARPRPCMRGLWRTLLVATARSRPVRASRPAGVVCARQD